MSLQNYNAVPPVSNDTIRQQLPNGTHTARLIKIIDLGTQELTFKNDDGSDKLPERQFVLTFETPTQKAVFKTENGSQPFLISKTMAFKISSEEATNISTLTKVFKATKGNLKDKNIFSLLGELLAITTEENKKGYAQIVNFTALSNDLDKNSEKFEQVNESQALYLEADIDYDLLNTLPKFLVDKIVVSPEYAKAKAKEKQAGKVEAGELPVIDIDSITNVKMPF